MSDRCQDTSVSANAHFFLLVAIMLTQLIAPFASSTSSQPRILVETDAELGCSQLGINPTKSHAEGWYNVEEGVGTIGLLSGCDGHFG